MMVNMMPHPKKANCSQRSGSFWRTAEDAAADEDGAMHERVTASGAAFRHYGVTEESETDATA